MSTHAVYDVIIVGAGSIGIPAAMALGKEKIKVLVLDKNASAGQGENKHAIGGIRATHSDPAKILTCLRSLEIFSQWQERHGDDIEWVEGGYCFPVYRDQEEIALKSILPIQQKFGLTIDFVSTEDIQSLVPGITSYQLRGGTFSPKDGTASPLVSLNAFYRFAVTHGVEFHFKEHVQQLCVEKGRIIGVQTAKGIYHSPVVIDAAGPFSRDLCKTVDISIPVTPESHEAAITEPVQSFFRCMVVDLRPAPGTKNYYFYQNKDGQVVFCISPEPPVIGIDTRETSVFLPQVSRRIISLIPRLSALRVRRVWRGLYPMSPDGLPIVGFNTQIHGLLHATGVCGQGFMLGPGLGEVIRRLIMQQSTENDKTILDGFSPYRTFGGQEKLK